MRGSSNGFFSSLHVGSCEINVENVRADVAGVNRRPGLSVVMARLRRFRISRLRVARRFLETDRRILSGVDRAMFAYGAYFLR